jgi:ribosomal protein S18 acetylase RimI-like enzyme
MLFPEAPICEAQAENHLSLFPVAIYCSMAAHDVPKVLSPLSEGEWEDYFDLRWRVLRAPWQQPRGSERDDLESGSEHLMIVGKDSRPLAIGRLHFNSPGEAQIRFMAVDPMAQGRGMGSAILQECERRARAAGAASIVLNAREDAQRFYQKHGFAVTEPAPTIFDTVKHVRMRKEL